MTLHPQEDLRQALYERLTTDALLPSLASGIYAFRGRTVAHPAVLIGEMESNEWSRLTERGAEISFTIDVITREQESGLCSRILARVQTLLHRAELPLKNHTLHFLRWQETRLNESSGGQTFTGRARFLARLIEV